MRRKRYLPVGTITIQYGIKSEIVYGPVGSKNSSPLLMFLTALIDMMLNSEIDAVKCLPSNFELSVHFSVCLVPRREGFLGTRKIPRIINESSSTKICLEDPYNYWSALQGQNGLSNWVVHFSMSSNVTKIMSSPYLRCCCGTKIRL